MKSPGSEGMRKKSGGGGAAVVVVVQLWLCFCGYGGGGGADVVVLWWWCGVVVLWWWCGVVLWWWCGAVWCCGGNMENYEDEPVTLTCRSKLKLIKLIRTKFRNTHREELFRNTCFGWLLDLDDSQENCVLIHFMSCPQVERSPEDTVAVPITYHVNGHYIGFGREEFCLITGLRFGLKFSERYQVGLIPFRRLLFDSDTDRGHVTGQMLVDNIYGEEFDNLHDEVDVALCQLVVLHLGLLVRAQLYDQLENANEVCAKKLYAAQNRPIPRPAKYTLSGFIWAFKTWILETYNVGALGYYTYQQRYPRAVAWSKITTFQRKNLPNFFEGQSKPKPVEVREHYGLPTLILAFFKTRRGCDRTGLKPSRSRPAVRSLTWPKGPQLIRRRLRIPSRHPTSYPGTPHIATPMAQQGFAMWSFANQAGPSQNHDVGIAHLDEMRRENNYDRFAWLLEDHINCWMELMIRDRPPGARYTVAKTWTSAMLDKLNKFVIETDFHLMGMLDGSSRPYPSWDDVDIVSICG
uniref:Phospholipase-like protein n=1 Tax=Tanacetum cinerariifolium TaxID=118510 RepID=A0A6L2MM61_TANCI|nr:phospholipase-like protein [Tanacetum cinerariifolium]